MRLRVGDYVHDDTRLYQIVAVQLGRFLLEDAQSFGCRSVTLAQLIRPPFAQVKRSLPDAD